MKKTAVLMAVALLLGMAANANAVMLRIISLNFSENKGNQHFTGGEMIGPLMTDSANWNNTNDYDGDLNAGTMTDLIDDSGENTHASVTWASSTVWWNNDGTGDDEHKMSVGYIDDGVTTEGVGVAITFNDIPFDSYRVYGLLASDAGDATGEYNARNVQVNGQWVFGGDETTLAPAYGNANASEAATGSLWSPADGVERGNYWTIDTSGSTLTIDNLPRDGANRGSITGVIIQETLPIPEPSTIVLGLFGLLGLALYRWRRR